jgi:hypothetical protein
MRTAPDLMYATMKTISYDEIRERLVRHHHPDESPEDQTIKVSHSSSDTSGEDVIFFAVFGCPPKGYGIFIQGRKLLILYTTRGRPFEEIMVDEVVNNV